MKQIVPSECPMISAVVAPTVSRNLEISAAISFHSIDFVCGDAP